MDSNPEKGANGGTLKSNEVENKLLTTIDRGQMKEYSSMMDSHAVINQSNNNSKDEETKSMVFSED